MDLDLNNLDLAADGLLIVAEEDRNTLEERALAKIIDIALDAVVGVRAERKQLQQSGDLSETGLNRRLEDFGNRALDRLESFAPGHIASAKEKAEVLEKRLAQIPTEEKGDAAVAKAIEIRSHLAELSDLDRMAVLDESIASGEREVAQAVFSAPVFLQRKLIASSDYRSDLRRRFLEQTQPAVAAELVDLKLMIGQAEGAIATARRHIAAASGTTAEPDVSALLQMA